MVLYHPVPAFDDARVTWETRVIKYTQDFQFVNVNKAEES